MKNLFVVSLIAACLAGCSQNQREEVSDTESVESSYSMEYPNLVGPVILDSEGVVVQHFKMEPGETAGMHSHTCQQMEILLSTGKGEIILPAAEGEEEERILLDMKKGDVRTIEASAEVHDFQNIDEVSIEWLLLTMVDTCVDPVELAQQGGES